MRPFAQIGLDSGGQVLSYVFGICILPRVDFADFSRAFFCSLWVIDTIIVEFAAINSGPTSNIFVISTMARNNENVAISSRVVVIL